MFEQHTLTPPLGGWATDSHTHLRSCGPPRAASAACLLQQLRLKIRQIKVLAVRLNLAVLVDLKDADAVDEENISGLGLKT